MKFLAYPKRKIRNTDWSGETIKVVTVVCPVRRGVAHPYTIRFLPANVIPRSPLQSAELISLIGDAAGPGQVNIEEACSALACLDPRTARKHISHVFASARRLASVSAKLVTVFGTAAPNQLIPPGTGALGTLALVWGRLLGGIKTAFGSDRSVQANGLRWVAPGLGRSLTISTCHESQAAVFHDTG